MKIILISSVILIIGVFCGSLISQLDYLKMRRSWAKVNNYITIRNDLSNYEISDNVASIEDEDISVELAQLVSLGELEHEVVIIPGAKNTQTNMVRWGEFVAHPDVIYSEYLGYNQIEEIPCIFTLWYKPAFKSKIDQFKREMK